MTLVLLHEEGPAEVVSRVAQGEARREHSLRDLIYDHPAVLPVHDLDPSYGRLFSVARELSIPGVGFVDVLLADEWGRLVVVECKLWRNPQARREVVGQILDYARELSRYGFEDLQRQISVARRQSGNVLYSLAVEAGCQLDEARFVDRVSRDLAAGRFMLLVVGDGIAEGTRRIGEYLQAQPGLAFEFGLIEMAEYRYMDASGAEHRIVQPRVLAQTAVIERHVIRAEVPGLVVDEVLPEPERQIRTLGSGSSDTNEAWSRFVDRFVRETQFDDPGQPPPRRGGIGWMKLPLPDGLYVNLYRSVREGGVGASVRFPTVEGQSAFSQLLAERDAIDREFAGAGLSSPSWDDGEVPAIRLSSAIPPPWDEAAEEAQRDWMRRTGNQFVNSLRPRLQRLERA